jgi:heat shock protein HtpX
MPEPLTLNLFEQQSANRRKSWLLVFGFLAFFLWLGLGGDLALWLATKDAIAAGEPVYRHRFPWIGLGLSLLAFFLTLDVLRNGAKRVIHGTGAEPLTDPQTPEERQLLNVVEEMAIASGMPVPKVYVIADPDPNAFVTGTKPLEAHLAVTQGLLGLLSRDELQAVVAHEMGHVKNEDTRLMTIIAGLGGAIIILRESLVRGVLRSGRMSGGSRRGGKGGNPLVVIVVVVWILSWILAPLIIRLMAMGVSRKREYLADAMAAQFTRNPAALADALDKLEKHHLPTKAISSGVAHLCIVDPLGRLANRREGRLSELFGTHPPMPIRISRLRAMAFQAQKREGDLTP